MEFEAHPSFDEVTDFIMQYSTYTPDKRGELREYIETHFNCRTAFVGIDPMGKITFVARWNIIDDGLTAHILDFYVREDCRRQHLIQDLFKRGKEIFPKVKRFCFEREKKYPGREQRYYDLDKILKRSK
jgi:hypothetical protein